MEMLHHLLSMVKTLDGGSNQCGFKSSHNIATSPFSVRVVGSVSGALEKMTNQGPMYNWHMPAK